MTTKLNEFSRGTNTFSVPMRLFHLNRQRLCQALSADSTIPKGSFVVLQGGSEIPRYNTDVNYVFRQESFFHWAFGVEEPDFFGAINIHSGKSFLFMPELPESYAVWLGKIHDQTHFRCKYEVDAVFYNKEMHKVLKSEGATKLFLLRGRNTDSDMLLEGADFEKLSEFSVDYEKLYPLITELRVFKTDLEIDLLRYICRVSSEAHMHVMKICKPGMHEFQMESEFLHYCYFHGGARLAGYTCIAASGENGACLHYGHAGNPNNRLIAESDMCLFDMGAEYCCYVSDITVSFPVSGKFTADQKLIYEAVLDANLSVQAAMKPGIKWVDMHLLAQKKILEHLKKGELLKGDVDEMMKAHLGAIFMPHGLGHFMGLDVHDVGGYAGDLKRIDAPSLRNLRTVRTLEARMVITVEPGCYFIDCLLNSALKNPEQAKFINESNIERFRGFGGVRIEDDILVTEDGVENLSGIIPRTVESIETFMKHRNL